MLKLLLSMVVLLNISYMIDEKMFEEHQGEVLSIANQLKFSSLYLFISVRSFIQMLLNP